MLIVVILTILAFDRRVIQMVDYSLLMTFVGFFIFVGNLGNIVASLASLISFKFYCKAADSRPLKFLGIFIVYNVIFPILLCLVNQATNFSF